MAYASREGSGKTAHLRSLARAFENRAKKMDIEEGSAFYRPVQEKLVSVAYASIKDQARQHIRAASP